ncbi:hypothetical protein M408DRAFT_18655 [Serendipita vermifera MAFF 305830]|uniref:NADH:quinone oxidoreductase/Mrp antiporter membrane subunit domain-containing protein n=1 Tax=Serendipita vermifera MAFF 305830 TaxID=933852 RepID=A0A0C3A5P3_SERVB|nr:hypothetical protein M408DRAFT_18655 [Serendipita vermifera MAFF 305830]
MYLLILFLPLMGSISAGLLGRKIGTSGSHFVTIACLAVASLLALLAFYEVALCASPVTINLGSWINSDLLTINWLFLFDISLFVHIYSVYYMSGEPHQQRFFSFLSLFTFFMLVLVAGGIGVSSYLLINYYYTRIASNKAAILAFNQNRVVFGSLDFDVVFSLAPSINPTLITIICILLFIGAGAKSAVLGLHSWLPVPTPVSSLLHAATLVTAGVYLLIRSSPLLEYSPTTLFFITIMGALTTLFAATSAFKALLFLGAGCVIHAMANQQDIRKLGGLISFLPFVYTVMLIGSLSLMALP